MKRTFCTTIALVATLSLSIAGGAQARGPGGHASAPSGGRGVAAGHGNFGGGRAPARGLPGGAVIRTIPRAPQGLPRYGLPGMRLPDGRLPDGRLPDARLPDGRTPDGRTPYGGDQRNLRRPDINPGRGNLYGRPMPVPGYGYPNGYPSDYPYGYDPNLDYPYPGLDAPLPSGYQGPPCGVWQTVGDDNGQQVLGTWDPYQGGYYYDDPAVGAVLIATWPDSCSQ